MVDAVYQEARSSLAQDDSIMGTNNSSIVSKRSVEKLYYPEPHFFRYFVKKPQRRSPLINRGYWLRMYAVDHVLQKFLQEPTDMKKVVINLGCGYDPLAFQSLAKQREQCKNTLFVDVDYPQLMRKKIDIILSAPQLGDLLGNVSTTPAPVLLRSESYLAIGCDLRDLEKLEGALVKELEPSQCMFLVMAEVSVTYMDIEAANALIAWVAKLNNVRFCCLEQHLPNGPNHPFAQTMMKHFAKLQTPLQSIIRYPTMANQMCRFNDNGGWPYVVARSLWELWSDETFLTRQQRIALNAVEPFDEYEEFALFASHYFLLIALKTPEFHNYFPGVPDAKGNPEVGKDSYYPHPTISPKAVLGLQEPPVSTPGVKFTHSSQKYVGARYGTILPMDGDRFGHHGGLGVQCRLGSIDFYALGDVKSSHDLTRSLIAPGARMCHTTTAFQDFDCLLVGGRASPDNAFADCWLRRDHTWQRVEDLPRPLYRHSSVSVRDNNDKPGVLVYGGRSNRGKVMNDWFLWQEDVGWRKVHYIGAPLAPRFGAALVNNRIGTGGLLLGGMSEDGVVLPEIWEWSFDCKEPSPQIIIRDQTYQIKPFLTLGSALYRFGASLVWSSRCLLLVGGILGGNLLEDNHDILGLIPVAQKFLPNGELSLHPFLVYECHPTYRPLLIGHSVFSNANGDEPMITVGGGAVCFSFGTFWNNGLWILHNACDVDEKISWSMVERQVDTNTNRTILNDLPPNREGHLETLGRPPVSIPRVLCESSLSFETIVSNSKPAVLEGLDLGPCVERWSLEYLKEAVGFERLVVVHEAKSPHMNFQSKNFKYVTKNFGTFIEDIDAGRHEYLRSLASEEPGHKPADFFTDYARLVPGFQLPRELEMVGRNLHSSVLRISGPVTMWLHYDVMANVLCQIRGSKRLVLYPPSDIQYLSIPHGASSSSINVFDTDSLIHSSLRYIQQHEVLLRPGDVLFIPPLWSHAASPSNNVSVATNVFFRTLRRGYAAGRDVYGNRDLQAYEKGRKDVEKIAKAFDGLPNDVRGFYVERLATELREKALMNVHK